MKKGIIIVLAIAIIGALGVAAKGHSNDAAPRAAPAEGKVSGANISTASPATSYKDGTYSGQSLDSPYGIVQVAAVIKSGKIADIKFLQMPNDIGHSQEVTSFSEPLLRQDSIKKQSAHIDFVSGATTTSQAYEQSLQSALDKASMS